VCKTDKRNAIHFIDPEETDDRSSIGGAAVGEVVATSAPDIDGGCAV
jgi:hypothetical protein